MKVSQLTEEIVKTHIRIDDTTENVAYILDGAKSFVIGYTGLPLTSSDAAVKSIDDYEDITIAVLALCQDMYDNRTFQVDGNNVNKVVESILGMHCRNLL